MQLTKQIQTQTQRQQQHCPSGLLSMRIARLSFRIVLVVAVAVVIDEKQI